MVFTQAIYGGGTNVLTTELAVELSLQPNAEGNTTFAEYSITEPDTGYTPIGWNVKSYTLENFLSSCVTVFEKIRGSWKIQFKNLNTLKSVAFNGTLRIAWLKE
jgi:hypothetical protein